MLTCGYLRLRMSSDKTDRLIRHLNVEFNAIGIASREERWTVRYCDLSPKLGPERLTELAWAVKAIPRRDDGVAHGYSRRRCRPSCTDRTPRASRSALLP